MPRSIRPVMSLLLALALCLGFSAPAYADNPAPAAPVAAQVATPAARAPDMAAPVKVDAGAPAAQPDLSNPIGVASDVISDVKAKNWMALASLILMALAFYARKYAPQAHFFQTFQGALTLCIGAGVLSAVGEAIYGGKLDVNTLFAGLSAVASAAFALAHPTASGQPAAPVAAPAVASK